MIEDKAVKKRHRSEEKAKPATQMFSRQYHLFLTLLSNILGGN